MSPAAAAAVPRAAPAADPLPAASRPTSPIARISLLLPDLFDAVGGIQTFCRTLVLALDGLAAERGWTVETLVLNDRGGSDLARLYMPGSAAGYRAFGGSRPRFAAAAVRAGLRSDVVVVGHVNFAPLALAMPGRARHLAAYGVDVWHRLSRLQRAAASRMDRILAISEFTRDRMAESNGLAAGRFTLFPTSLDPLHHGGAAPLGREQLGLAGRRVILSVSRLAADERYKGIDTVIRALPAIRERVPDVCYVVVGTGTDQPRLEALAREVGVEGCVRFAGRVRDDELSSFYHHCDVFALPSLKEGFGIVFLEAMQVAKPCVTVRAGAAPEVVEDGITGFVVPPDGGDALSGVLVRLLADEALRARMGRAGRERLARHFSFDLFRDRLEGVLCG